MGVVALSRYSKSAYADVAKILNDEAVTAMQAADVQGAYTVHEVMVRFVDLFAADNERFDRDKFILACGFEPSQTEAIEKAGKEAEFR